MSNPLRELIVAHDILPLFVPSGITAFGSNPSFLSGFESANPIHQSAAFPEVVNRNKQSSASNAASSIGGSMPDAGMMGSTKSRKALSLMQNTSTNGRSEALIVGATAGLAAYTASKAADTLVLPAFSKAASWVSGAASRLWSATGTAANMDWASCASALSAHPYLSLAILAAGGGAAAYKLRSRWGAQMQAQTDGGFQAAGKTEGSQVEEQPSVGSEGSVTSEGWVESEGSVKAPA